MKYGLLKDWHEKDWSFWNVAIEKRLNGQENFWDREGILTTVLKGNVEGKRGKK